MANMRSVKRKAVMVLPELEDIARLRRYAEERGMFNAKGEPNIAGALNEISSLELRRMYTDMDLSDKSLVIAFLQTPRLGLSPAQIVKIEDIIDGRPHEETPAVIDFKEAARRLGLKSKTSDRTVALWARQGILTPVIPPGRHNAIGVTAESLERMALSSTPTKTSNPS